MSILLRISHRKHSWHSLQIRRKRGGRDESEPKVVGFVPFDKGIFAWSAKREEWHRFGNGECNRLKHNIHQNESFRVNWEYIKHTINPRMKWQPLESWRVQVKKLHLISRRKLRSDVLPKIDHFGWQFMLTWLQLAWTLWLQIYYF